MSTATTAKTVLIVEDDEPTQKLLKAVMQRVGFTSVVAGNGGIAIEMLKHAPYGVVILDLMMPSVAGVSVIEFLEKQDQPTPVIVCTAAGPRATQELKSPLVRAIFRKPFDIDELAGTVSAVING